VPITTADVKLLASERMTDNEDGGGMVRGNVVIADGVSNAIFPDISELDRTYGRVNLRKVFPSVQTSDTDSYYGAHCIIEDAPDDPLVSASLFSTEDWVDERTNAVSRLESYLARGAKTPYYLWEQHITGQMAIQALARVGTELPSIGSTIVLVKNPGLSTEAEQFVRITSVAGQERQFSYAYSGGFVDFTRLALTLGISDPLTFDIMGGAARPDDDANLITSRIYDTVVADAARYFGIRPLTVAASQGDLTFQADTIYHQLVPSAQTEIPVTDAKPHGDAAQVTAAASETVTVTTAADFDSTHAIFAGQAILPGTLTMTTGTGATLTDDNGTLMSGATQVGLVDYANGVLSIIPGGPDYGGASKNITFRPSVAPARSLQSASFPVTTESRSQTVVAYLDPIPQPGTLRVSYMAQGKWYVLMDRGGGKINGADVTFGSGTVSYTTGSVVVTLGVLPDVGSAVIMTYGLATTDMVRAGIALQAEKRFTLPHTDIAKNTVTLTWPNGSGGNYTVTDNGSGLLTGSGTGYIEYDTGVVVLIPSVLPPIGAEIDVDYSTNADINTVQAVFNDPARDGTGKINLILPDNGIVPGSITVTWTVDVDETLLDSHFIDYASSVVMWSSTGWYLSNIGQVYTSG